MSIADTCEESAFEHGRSVAIEGFTTKELVEELCKRERVTCIDFPDMKHIVVQFQHHLQK
jgi:hypothetical protein